MATLSDASAESVDLAVIVTVSERYDAIRPLYFEYKRALDSLSYRYQFTYVLDGDFPDVFEELKRLQQEGEALRVIKLSRSFGEAAALTAGFDNSQGDLVLTLPPYHQVEAAEIPRLVEGLERCDMVLARRFPRADSRFNRVQTAIFNGLTRVLTGSAFHDLGCSVRAFKRNVAAEIPVYGDQHRFFPLFAARQGFTVREIDLRQSARDAPWRVYRLGIYPRRLLDLFTVFFLAKFTKKPLRFFGLIGLSVFAIGAIVVCYVVLERFLGVELAERPALLLGSLLIVLGAQIFALGLLGELIIFTHARDLKEYTVDKIIN